MSLPRPDVEGFVLAGGRSSRMGQDKAVLEVKGRQLIQHALETLTEAGLTARIAGARSELSAFAPVVPDARGETGLGPLAGICAALAACTSRFAVFLPVDLPLVPSSLIEYLVHHAVVTEAAVTVVSVTGFVQTFPAIVDREALRWLRETLHSGDRNCLRALRAAGAGMPGGISVLPIELLVQPGQVRHPWGLYPGQWFLNVNAPEHLKMLDQVIDGADQRAGGSSPRLQ